MSVQSASIYQLNAHSLLDHSQAELNDLFYNLAWPASGELNGRYKGTLLAIIGLNWLPRILRAWLYRLLRTFINPWTGKRFDKTEGANIWFTRSGKICFGYYNIEDSHQGEDGLPLTQLSYDVDKNIGILRPVRGEVRKLHDDLFLARMHYKKRNRTVRVLYFTLERIDD